MTDGRKPLDVLDRHLELRRAARMEDDLAENYAPDVVVLTRWGQDRGHDAMRRMAAKLEEEIPAAEFSYKEVLVEDEFGYLEWSGTGQNGATACSGADSYVVRDGAIVCQTIHYNLHEPKGGQSAG